MVMPSFGCAFGMAGSYPVSGFVTGAFKAIFFYESFEQIQRLIIDYKPVIGDSLDIQWQNFWSQAFDRNEGQNKEARIIGDKMQVIFFGLFIPADKGLPGFHRPGLPG